MADITVASAIKRGFLFLEDGEWSRATDYFEKALDIEPENSNAYMGLLLADLNIPNEEKLVESATGFCNNDYFIKAVRFAPEDDKRRLQSINTENIYKRAFSLLSTSHTEAEYKTVMELFSLIREYKDVEVKIEECRKRIEEEHLGTINIQKKKRRSVTTAVIIALSIVLITVGLLMHKKSVEQQKLMDAQKEIEMTLEGLRFKGDAFGITGWDYIQFLPNRQVKYYFGHIEGTLKDGVWVEDPYYEGEYQIDVANSTHGITVTWDGAKAVIYSGSNGKPDKLSLRDSGRTKSFSIG